MVTKTKTGSITKIPKPNTFKSEPKDLNVKKDRKNINMNNLIRLFYL